MAFEDVQAGAKIDEAGFPVRVTLAGTVSRGDLIGYSSGWKRALATVGSVIHSRLVAGEDGVSGDVITCYQHAIVSGRFSEVAAGSPYYLAEGSDNGKVTGTGPSTSGDVNTIIGVGLDTTRILLWPGLRPDSLA
jgi:hypothetical protein